jgi:hypothetical protein
MTAFALSCLLLCRGLPARCPDHGPGDQRVVRRQSSDTAHNVLTENRFEQMMTPDT